MKRWLSGPSTCQTRTTTRVGIPGNLCKCQVDVRPAVILAVEGRERGMPRARLLIRLVMSASSVPCLPHAYNPPHVRLPPPTHTHSKGTFCASEEEHHGLFQKLLWDGGAAHMQVQPVDDALHELLKYMRHGWARRCLLRRAHSSPAWRIPFCSTAAPKELLRIQPPGPESAASARQPRDNQEGDIRRAGSRLGGAGPIERN